MGSCQESLRSVWRLLLCLSVKLQIISILDTVTLSQQLLSSNTRMQPVGPQSASSTDCQTLDRRTTTSRALQITLIGPIGCTRIALQEFLTPLTFASPALPISPTLAIT